MHEEDQTLAEPDQVSTPLRSAQPPLDRGQWMWLPPLTSMTAPVT